MTDDEYKQLAQLVTYLLESEDWKYIWINEYAEPIRLFMFRTHITYRRVHKYVKVALQKLLGPIFNETQQRLANKCCAENDLFFKPKTEAQKIKEKPTKSLVQHKPTTEFGKKFLQHYGFGATVKPSLYVRERRIYQETGKTSWELRK